jgi:hypothetical protein
VVFTALKNNRRSIQFADISIRNNRNVMKELIVHQDPSLFKFASPKLKQDPEFVLDLLRENNDVHLFLQDVKDDRIIEAIIDILIKKNHVYPPERIVEIIEYEIKEQQSIYEDKKKFALELLHQKLKSKESKEGGKKKRKKKKKTFKSGFRKTR